MSEIPGEQSAGSAVPRSGTSSGKAGQKFSRATMREFSADELAEMFGPILWAIRHELTGALWKFPSFNSPHEGWAVICEELDELWEHVKANEGHTAEAQQEALQIAAMACRYVLDLTNEEAL